MVSVITLALIELGTVYRYSCVSLEEIQQFSPLIKHVGEKSKIPDPHVRTDVRLVLVVEAAT